jgi:hypothetical protein
MPKDSPLFTIGARAFAKCTYLRSFDIAGCIGEIDSKYFMKCILLYRFKFMSSESGKKGIGDRSLDDTLDGFGVTANSSLFRIEVKDGGV